MVLEKEKIKMKRDIKWTQMKTTHAHTIQEHTGLKEPAPRISEWLVTLTSQLGHHNY